MFKSEPCAFDLVKLYQSLLIKASEIYIYFRLKITCFCLRAGKVFTVWRGAWRGVAWGAGRGARGAGRGVAWRGVATPPYWEHEAARGGGEGRGDIAAPIAIEKVSPPTWI